MDAFFASVEQRDHPEYRGKPVVVGAQPNQRGVVAAASYEARKFGIRSAMPSVEAGRRCPHAIFVPPNMPRYQAASRDVFAVFERYTPHVEPVSVDEAFLDVTGARALFGDGPTIARRIKTDVRAETGLTASVGVAPNKFLAKLASDLDKPDGLTVVPVEPAAITAFLRPMPVGRIWGVGKVTEAMLRARGIATIGHVQDVDIRSLAVLVGESTAGHLKDLAFGRDDRELEAEQAEKSISREHTFPKDCTSRAELQAVLRDLIDDVGGSLRRTPCRARVLRLKLRWSDFTTITRQVQLQPPCRDGFALRDAAVKLFDEQLLAGPVRLIGIGVAGLTTAYAEQLGLFDAPRDRRATRERLSSSIDRIRDRFGKDAIRNG